jgi:hypothetical protein
MENKKKKQMVIAICLGILILLAIVLVQLLAPENANFIYQNF